MMNTMKRVRLLMISAWAMVSTGLQAQETAEMVFPQAEWSKAGDILMHTPGQELFNGVIHPSAGLFEDYFDVDKAAEEHRGYISMLEANGIRVHTVTGILNEVGIDSLRTLASHLLA
jgi:arginine deiminase